MWMCTFGETDSQLCMAERSTWAADKSSLLTDSTAAEPEESVAAFMKAVVRTLSICNECAEH